MFKHLNTFETYKQGITEEKMYQVTYPTSDITKRHIVNYDKLREFDPKSPLRYFAFPQKGTTIFFLKNATVESEVNHITISKSDEENLKVVFLGKYTQPLIFTYLDFVPEVAINFKETGINYFFLNSWRKNELFTVFDGALIDLDAEKLFSSDDIILRNYLESYFNNRYASLKISAIEKAVILINDDSKQTVAAIAEQVFLTEKTLNRQFQKYVGCTISKYKSIVRFRKTLETHFKNNQLNLTELCLENNYFDSPHFYKEIKKIASFNPKDFFNKVKVNGLGAYPYVFG